MNTDDKAPVERDISLIESSTPLSADAKHEVAELLGVPPLEKRRRSSFKGSTVALIEVRINADKEHVGDATTGGRDVTKTDREQIEAVMGFLRQRKIRYKLLVEIADASFE